MKLYDDKKKEIMILLCMAFKYKIFDMELLAYKFFCIKNQMI